MPVNYTIRSIQDGDLERILTSFHWQSRAQWENYFAQHARGERVSLVAIQNAQVAGYAHLVWQSDYAPFAAADIPEINNMHVLPEYQRQGIGTALIDAAEAIAARTGKTAIGIGVAQEENYADAQRLYPQLGFIPDGRGLLPTQWGMILYMTRPISA